MQRVFSQDLLELGVSLKNKQQVIARLADLLFSQGYLTSRKEFIRDVLEREAAISTAVGFGVAIPHARSKAVKKTGVAVMRLLDPVCWDDSLPVSLVFLLAVPPEASKTHLKLIAGLAEMLLEEDFRKKLFKADRREILEILFVLEEGLA